MANQRTKNGFGLVSCTVMRDPEVSLGEKAVYAHLSTYADSSNSLFVSIDRIATECGIATSTVKRQIASLEQKGIISRVNRGHKLTKITILLK